MLMHSLQDHLLEVGWNNSPSTQRDVEKSINCCGFRQVDYNGTCDAVSLNPHRILTSLPPAPCSQFTNIIVCLSCPPCRCVSLTTLVSPVQIRSRNMPEKFCTLLEGSDSFSASLRWVTAATLLSAEGLSTGSFVVAIVRVQTVGTNCRVGAVVEVVALAVAALAITVLVPLMHQWE